MTMDAIQGLVTGALLGDEYEEAVETPESLYEIAKQSTNEALLLAEGRYLEGFLADPSKTSDNDAVRNALARYGAMFLGSGMSRGYGLSNTAGRLDGPTLLLMALDFAEEPDQAKVEAAREALFRNNNWMEANQLTRSTVTSIDYLEQIWGDELVERLSAYTGTKAPTVKKWVRDQANPASSSCSQICALTQALFELHAGCGMSRDEVLSWWDAPNPDLGGQSPHEKVAGGHWSWSLDSDVTAAIGKAGGGIGYRKDH